MKSTVKNKQNMTLITINDKFDDSVINVLKNIHSKIKSKHIIIDFQNLRLINSYGASAWIKFMGSLASAKVEFHNCTPEFMAFANMLEPARSNAEFHSFLVPYHCSECNEPKLISFDANKVSKNSDFPNIPCTKCKNEMEPEVFADEYLANV